MLGGNKATTVRIKKKVGKHSMISTKRMMIVSMVKNPNFLFYGKFEDGVSRKGFVINEGGVILSDDEKIKYTKILNNFLDAFIPKTLREKFSEYQGTTKFSENGKILLQYFLLIH